MSKYSFDIEKGAAGLLSIRISDEDGGLYRYYASISDNSTLLEKIKEYFDSGDVSVEHIDDIICDIIYLKK